MNVCLLCPPLLLYEWVGFQVSPLIQNRLSHLFPFALLQIGFHEIVS